MIKDRNADKRLEYHLKISEKERESDELRFEEHQAQNVIENFETVMMSGFRKIQEIDDNFERIGHRQSVYDETAQKQHYLSKVILQQQDGLKQAYQASALKLEAEHERLQRERDNLAWD